MQPAHFVEEFRQALAEADPRATVTARIRLLLPIIERRLANGSSYAAIVEDLNAAGISITKSFFAKALWRLRRRNRAESPTPNASIQPERPHAASLEMKAVYGRPGQIESPADLRKIRDMHVDLDALREEGRAMQADRKPT